MPLPKTLLFLVAMVVLSLRAQAEGAVVVKFGGKVLFGTSPGTILAKSGTHIPPDTLINTYAKNAFVVLRTPKGSLVKLEGGHAVYREEKATVIDLVVGALFAVAKPHLTEPVLEVRTRSTVMGVRGTEFFVQETLKYSYLCVCEGVVRAAKRADARQTKDVKAGYDLHATQEQNLAEPSEASEAMLNMAKKGIAEMSEGSK